MRGKETNQATEWRGTSRSEFRHPMCRLLAGYLRHLPDHSGKVRLVNLVRRVVPANAWVALDAQTATVLSVDPDEYIGWSVLSRGDFEPQSIALCLDIMHKQGGWFG